MLLYVNPMRFGDLLDPVLETLRIHLNNTQIEILKHHLDLLLLWSKKISLTSIEAPDLLIQRHFGESLFLAKALANQTGTLADLGSGAGFPGVPIAVACPFLNVTLVESNGKKAAFLKEVARSVSNVRVFHGRFEDSAGHFDWVVTRAVSVQDLLASIAKRADNIALLVGRATAASLSGTKPFHWSAPFVLPWGRDRVLLIGNVPRGTLRP